MTKKKIEVAITPACLAALDKVRGSQSREEYLSQWIAAHWKSKK